MWDKLWSIAKFSGIFIFSIGAVLMITNHKINGSKPNFFDIIILLFLAHIPAILYSLSIKFFKKG